MSSERGSDKRSNLWRAIHATWYVLAVVALGIFIASLPAYAMEVVSPPTIIAFDASPTIVVTMTALGALASIAAALVSFSLAFILFRRKPRDLMALYVSFYLLVYGVVAAGPLGALEGSRRMTESLTVLAEAILLTTPTITLFLIFPSGHFVPHWTRWVSVLSVVWIIVAFGMFGHPPNLFDFWSLSAVLASLFAWALVAVYGLIYRYRRVSNLVEREQTKWVVFGMVTWFALIAITMVPYLITQAAPRDTPQPLWALMLGPTWWLSLNLLPLSLSIAVMRYHLFDIDILINRALVYGTLTVITMAIYILTVGSLGGLFQAIGQPVTAFLATGLVAVLFQPLRERLQRAVNRLTYGERDDPYIVLSRLGRRLEAALAPEAVLPAIVETVAQTLKLPCVGIALREGDEFKIVAAYPSSPIPVSAEEGRKVIRNERGGEVLPLIYQGETIGQLIFAPRSPGESFAPSEQRLLQDIARQAGVAVHALRLTADLQHSRERLVTTREEERRRLRRDLHDGLGPQLASQTLTLSAARTLLRNDPEAADALLVEAMRHAQGAIADIRRLVYDLRPPALDDLGLVAALRAQAAQYEPLGTRLTVVAPEHLPPLPAAVEVACYRIAQEALTNVVRHAHARTSEICLSLQSAGTPALELEIVDDGIGLQVDHAAGVGLTSMRERAEELGGTCVVERRGQDGTRVCARLPLLRKG